MVKCRGRRLIVVMPSSLGEDRVLWGGCMKRRVQRNTLSRKIDNFWSTYAWTPSVVRVLARVSVFSITVVDT